MFMWPYWKEHGFQPPAMGDGNMTLKEQWSIKPSNASSRNSALNEMRLVPTLELTYSIIYCYIYLASSCPVFRLFALDSNPFFANSKELMSNFNIK
jgi:hypothetical protein